MLRKGMESWLLDGKSLFYPSCLIRLKKGIKSLNLGCMPGIRRWMIGILVMIDLFGQEGMDVIGLIPIIRSIGQRLGGTTRMGMTDIFRRDTDYADRQMGLGRITTGTTMKRTVHRGVIVTTNGQERGGRHLATDAIRLEDQDRTGREMSILRGQGMSTGIPRLGQIGVNTNTIPHWTGVLRILLVLIPCNSHTPPTRRDVSHRSKTSGSSTRKRRDDVSVNAITPFPGDQATTPSARNQPHRSSILTLLHCPPGHIRKDLYQEARVDTRIRRGY